MQLKIFDDIIDDRQAQELRFWGVEQGVCFRDIDEFLKAIPDGDNEIDLRLNCCGGDVATGWSIVDKLRASGKKITATVEGTAASMASVVLLAASERKAYPHSQILIHDPYYPEYSLYESYKAEDLDKLAESLRAESARILDFYVERTGSDRATLEAIMDEDRPMYAQEAKELGFITEILPPISASVRHHKSILFNKMSKSTKKQSALAKAMQALQAALRLDDPKPVSYELQTADGATLTIDKPEGEDPVVVGDTASPDGEHLMPDGTTIVVADGVITEIRPADEPAEDEDEDAVNEAMQQITDQIQRLRATAKTPEEQAILDKVKAAGGAEWLDKAISSQYQPATRQTRSKQAATAAESSKLSERLDALRKKNQ